MTQELQSSETVDDQVVTNETQDTQDTPDQSQDQEFDPKARVEFTTPEQQKKFNDVYKQMRMSDSRNRMLNDTLAKAMDKISEFESRFSQTDHAEAERILNGRLKEARDAGDENKADKILQEIIDFRVDSKIKAKVPDKKPAVVDPMSGPDVRTVVSFAQETDAGGKPLRPWISDQHPQHANAMRIAGAVALSVNEEFGYPDLEEILKRMDDAMKVKPVTTPAGNSRAPDPMRGNLTNGGPKGKMKLSPQELAAAQKMGVKPEDYLKWKR